MGKREDEDKLLSQEVIKSKSDETLLGARKFLKSFLDLRGLEKLNDTYISGAKDALAFTGDGKIYVDYRLDGTATGRLSNAAYDCGTKMGVSFHTLPRNTEFNIRSYVVAPEGHDFITCDMKSMELRILAHLAREKKMAQAFHDKVDLHTYSASMTFSKPMDKVTKEERQIAKTVSFLVVYGGNASTLARKQGLPLKRAESIINNWMEAFPGVPLYMSHVHNYIMKNKYAYTIFGRRRHLPNVDSKEQYVQKAALRQGLNFTVQSAASDTLLCALIGIYNKYKQEKMSSKIVATVHDSLEVISPKHETKKAIEIIHDEMINYHYAKKHFGISFNVPLEIEILVGPSFGIGEEVHYL